MFAQCSNVIQRQIAGCVAPAVTQLVVIDAQVIAQITAEGVNTGLPMSSLRERSTVPALRA